jgi:hypothetical protein
MYNKIIIVALIYYNRVMVHMEHRTLKFEHSII